MRKMVFAAVLACGGLMTAQAMAEASVQNAGDNFRHLAHEYFTNVTFKFAPTAGKLTGLHQYDSQLEDYSRAGVVRDIAALKEYEAKFDAVDGSKLNLSTQGDLEMVRNNIRGNLLELEKIRGWEKNPDTYSSGITASAFSLMERKFAPADERLRSLIAREKQMPAALIEARQNLKNPPLIYTQIALEQLPGLISFFEHDVPQAFADAKDPATIAEFHKTNAAVVNALEDYQQWVKTDLLPQSHGDFRIGATTFSEKLKYDEIVTTPLPKLLEIAYADMHKNQAQFARVAKELDPTKTPQQVLAELGADHPAPDHLLQAFHDKFDSEIAFIRSHNIITIPSNVQPVLEETPPFMRATTQASMDSPGPFETHSTTAYFNVTLPEKSWSAKRTAEYMSDFNAGTLVSVSVHEAYPGHYVQFLWVNHSNLSEVRKLITSNTNVEGWAHYCEEMMLDEGYGQPGAGATDVRGAGRRIRPIFITRWASWRS